MIVYCHSRNIGNIDHRQIHRDATNHRREFFRCLTEKMLTYALGRGVEHSDRCAVDKICQQVADRQDHFAALVLAIVQSEPFQMRMAKGSNP